MQLVTKRLAGTWIVFELGDVGAVYPGEDVIYIKGEPCLLSGCTTLVPSLAYLAEPNLSEPIRQLLVECHITLLAAEPVVLAHASQQTVAKVKDTLARVAAVITLTESASDIPESDGDENTMPF